MSSKREDIEKLVRLLGSELETVAEGKMDAVWQMISRNIPPDQMGKAEAEKIKFLQRANLPEKLMKRHVKAYDSRFTHDEIKEMVRFHASPTGRKFVEEVTSITADFLKASGDLFHKTSLELIDHLQQAGAIPTDVKSKKAKDSIMSSVLKRMSN